MNQMVFRGSGFVFRVNNGFKVSFFRVCFQGSFFEAIGGQKKP